MSQNQAAEEIIALTVQDDEAADSNSDSLDTMTSVASNAFAQDENDKQHSDKRKDMQSLLYPNALDINSDIAIETSEIETEPDYTELLETCQKWFDERQHQKIVDEIEAIPEEKRTPLLQCELGRAYNNVAKLGDKKAFQKALQCLKPLEEVLKTDFRWNYRIGYTYYHLEQEWNALHYFQSALLLRNQDQDTIQFIHKCFSALGAPEFVYNFASRVDRMWEEFLHKESDWRKQLEEKLDFKPILEQIEEVVEQALIHPHLAMSCDEGSASDHAKFVLTFELNNTTTLIYALRYIVAHAPKLLSRHWHFTVGHEKNELWQFGNDATVDPSKILIKMLDAKRMELVHAEQDASSKMLSLYGNPDVRDDHIETSSFVAPDKLRALNEDDSETVCSNGSTDLNGVSQDQLSSSKSQGKQSIPSDQIAENQDQILPLYEEELVALHVIQGKGTAMLGANEEAYRESFAGKSTSALVLEQEHKDSSTNDKIQSNSESEADAKAQAHTKTKAESESTAEIETKSKLEDSPEATKEADLNEKAKSKLNTLFDEIVAQATNPELLAGKMPPYVPQLIKPQTPEKYSISLYSEELSRLLRENHRRSTPEVRDKIQALVSNIMRITHTKLGECTAFTAFASFRFTGEKHMFDDIQASAFSLSEIDSQVDKLGFKLNLTDGELVEEYMKHSYKLMPNFNPNEPKLRQEIFRGWSQLPQLCNEYSLDETTLVNLYHQHGIVLGFISYEFGDCSSPAVKVSKEREELQERLIKFINLHPMCLVIGGAHGLYHDYVDFICFGDIRAFQRELHSWCIMHKDTPMMIYAPFRFSPVTIIYDAVAEANKAEMKKDLELIRQATQQGLAEQDSERQSAGTKAEVKADIRASNGASDGTNADANERVNEEAQAHNKSQASESTETKACEQDISTSKKSGGEHESAIFSTPKTPVLEVAGTSSLSTMTPIQEQALEESKFVSTFHPKLVKATLHKKVQESKVGESKTKQDQSQEPAQGAKSHQDLSEMEPTEHSVSERKLVAQRALEQILTKIKNRHEVEFHPSEALKQALNLFTPEDKALQEQKEKEAAAAIQAKIEAGLPIMLDGPEEADASKAETKDEDNDESTSKSKQQSDTVALKQADSSIDDKLTAQQKSEQTTEDELPSIVVQEQVNTPLLKYGSLMSLPLKP